MVTLDQVTSNVAGIVAELTGVHHTWVTMESVVAVLLDRYNIASFDALAVGSPFEVPILNLIHELNSKLSLYLDTYVATQTSQDSGFMCYKDCEAGALSILRSFSLLPLSHILVSGRASCDKNELEIDSDLEPPELEPARKKRRIHFPETMCEYGIGSLQMHPLVISVFGSLPIAVSNSTPSFLGRSDILTLLLEFQEAGGEIASSTNEMCFSASSFGDFVKSLRALTLREAGVRLIVRPPQGSVRLGQEVTVMFRHVQAWHTSHMKEWKMRQLDIMQKSAAEQKRVLHSLTSSSAAPVPTVALPKGGLAADFCSACVTDLEKGGGYAPSFAKTLSSVKKVLQSQKDLSEAAPQLLTEYLMLHVGSSKYRRGKFEVKKLSEESEDNAADKLVPLATPTSFRLLLAQDTGLDFSAGGKGADSGEQVVASYESKKSMPNAGPNEIVNSRTLQGLCTNASWAATQGSASTASSLDMREVGRWGEALVFQFLLMQHPRATVTWVNKDAESMACYDIKVEERIPGASDRIKTTFVEVKSSRFDASNVFDISPNEWAFASGTPPIQYDVYRVYNAGRKDCVFLHIVRNLLNSVTEQRVRLCLAV